jgi:hypothetical protein
VVNPRSQTLLVLGGAAALALCLVAVIPSLSALGRVDNDNFNHWVRVNFALGGSTIYASVVIPFRACRVCRNRSQYGCICPTCWLTSSIPVT